MGESHWSGHNMGRSAEIYAILEIGFLLWCIAMVYLPILSLDT